MIKIQVERYNGMTEIVEVETFDAAELETKMNSSNVIGIAIGNQMFSRIDIKHVKIITEPFEVPEA